MVRLMLVLAPAACMLAAIGASKTLKTFMRALKRRERSKSKKSDESKSIPSQIALVMVFGITFMFVFYVIHCTWVTSEAYSSPSIVLAARGHQGQRIIFDDFREAYYWLSQNTADDARVMSWWDYGNSILHIYILGYQITAMANRTVLVDNNTWNNTHIATVGKAMASNEPDAYKIMKRLDVDYVLVIFGGLTGS